jgi:hypothetical protein
LLSSFAAWCLLAGATAAVTCSSPASLLTEGLGPLLIERVGLLGRGRSLQASGHTTEQRARVSRHSTPVATPRPTLTFLTAAGVGATFFLGACGPQCTRLRDPLLERDGCRCH